MSKSLHRLLVPLAVLTGFSLFNQFTAFQGEAKGNRISSLAGPFRMIPGVPLLEQCPPELEPKKYHGIVHYFLSTRDRHNPDVWFYSAKATSWTTVGDNLTVKGSLATWSSGGGWKENALVTHIPKPCTVLRQRWPNVWRLALQYAFNDTTRDCPFPPGTYMGTNVSSDFDINFPPSFFYGKYRGTAQVVDGKTMEVIACKRVYFTLVPKLAKQKT